MAGHIRSIVSQRGGVAPVDNDTLFLAHYDEHAHDVLRGTKVSGNQYSMKFDTGRIDCGSNSAFDMTTGITIEGWVYFTENATKEMFIKGTSSYEFFQSGQGITFRTTGNTLASVNSIPLRTWTHVAATFDGITKSIYINGTLDASVAHATPISITSSPFVIGAYADGQYQYKGRFSDVRLWSVALSTSEIKQSMNEPPKHDGLVGWWRLDESDGLVSYDYSPNGNDGLIVGVNSLAEGKAIYSLAGEGHPGDSGRGVLIEEGTTNLINPNGFVSDSNFKVEKLDNYTFKVTLLAVPVTNSYYIGQSSLILANQPVTMSIEVLEQSNPSWKIGVGGWGEITSSSGGSSAKIGNKYIRTITHNVDWTYSISLGYINDASRASLLVGDYIIVKNAQMEQKSFATSFVNGTRSRAQLQYPLSIINPNQYTVSCWVNFNWVNPSGTHQTILEVDEAPGGSTYRFLMFVESNQIGVLNANDTTQSVAYGLTGVQANKWYHLAASFDGTRLKYYVDGKLKSDIPSVVPAFKENAMFGVGGPNWNTLNGRVDELRIDRVARTDKEIQSWYYQGRNGW